MLERMDAGTESLVEVGGDRLLDASDTRELL